MTALAGVMTAALLALLIPVSPGLERPGGVTPVRPDSDWMRRWRPLWVLLAAVACLLFLGGVVGVVAAPVAGAVTWWVVERSEPAHVRLDRDLARRELPHVAGLLADALGSGQAPVDAVAVVASALPGPASARLAALLPRLRLGVDPGQVWSDLATDPALAPLGRTLARAHRTGAPVVAAVDRLADELAVQARADIEDRARAVGVKAAVPLGLCLLPAFLLIGIVPVVAGLLTSLGL